jgi:hypothetical protein
MGTDEQDTVLGVPMQPGAAPPPAPPLPVVPPLPTVPPVPVVPPVPAVPPLPTVPLPAVPPLPPVVAPPPPPQSIARTEAPRQAPISPTLAPASSLLDRRGVMEGTLTFAIPVPIRRTTNLRIRTIRPTPPSKIPDIFVAITRLIPARAGLRSRASTSLIS